MTGAPEVLRLRQWVIFFGAREGEGRITTRVIAITWGVAVVTQIADDEVTAGEATLELDLEGWVAQEAFTLAATEEDNRSTLRRID